MFRNFCFTLNNYTQEEVNKIDNFKYKYLVYGKEIGEQGTKHLQGYCELHNPMRLATLKNQFSTRAHYEKRRGTQDQAIDYCKKDNDFTENGTKSEQGKRVDLDRCRKLASEEGMRRVTEECSFQQIKVAEKYLTYNEEPRDWKPYVYWLWGPTGTGKSQTARELAPDDTYTKNDGTKWWDGYDKHECVIIDDFRDSWWTLTEMLSLLDRYEKRVEFKGGYRQFLPKLIIITSANKPTACYQNCGEAINQLTRRIDTTCRL